MASRIWDKLLGLGKDRVVLTGKFFPNGASNPSSTVGAGFNAVTRAGAGLYDITLQDAYPDMLHSDVWAWQQTPDNKYARPISYTPATRTVRVALWDTTLNAGAGGGVDMTANAANYITFQLTMSNSSIVLGG